MCSPCAPPGVDKENVQLSPSSALSSGGRTRHGSASQVQKQRSAGSFKRPSIKKIVWSAREHPLHLPPPPPPASSTSTTPPPACQASCCTLLIAPFISSFFIVVALAAEQVILCWGRFLARANLNFVLLEIFFQILHLKNLWWRRIYFFLSVLLQFETSAVTKIMCWKRIPLKFKELQSGHQGSKWTWIVTLLRQFTQKGSWDSVFMCWNWIHHMSLGLPKHSSVSQMDQMTAAVGSESVRQDLHSGPAQTSQLPSPSPVHILHRQIMYN